MMLAIGWIVVRASREAYKHLEASGGAREDWASTVDVIDEAVDSADESLFRALRGYLSSYTSPDLDWNLAEQLNNHGGLLNIRSSRNHRAEQPSFVALLRWLAENGQGSYGLVYMHDDEDDGNAPGRHGDDHRNVFRVWRLLNGVVEELDDPFLSPMQPRINPNEWA